MIELPEALARADELKRELKNKKVEKVYPPSSPHKFCWFNGEASSYDRMLKGRQVTDAHGFGIFAEIIFEGDFKLCFNDGVNVRIFGTGDEIPVKYQLRADFSDGTVLMYLSALSGV